ncbi:citrulline utilization hydrolase CtlX [Pseudorhodobacter ferrugineus]|uniref:citrulline utilization hydrolase CtlX n=1 Tax=Pseudorhodobacter ferrugineus TaxID=77008 RepID=UPI0003B47EDF|nr:arginine deiminase-related protein [Pseudorhodobacter ferrugineus]
MAPKPAPLRRNLAKAPDAVIMIRSHAFHPNPETHADNAFQRKANAARDAGSVHTLAEFDVGVAQLHSAGVRVLVFDDDDSCDTPDSVFPNNWFSTQTGGHVAVYPMFAPSRRRERRQDVLDFLKTAYRVQDIIDYSWLEQDGLALEGTGAMVLDHIRRIAFTLKSNRADPIALERFCTNFGYEPMIFDAHDHEGKEIYHTNVLMCIGTDMAMVGLEQIINPARRAEIVERLEETGREVIFLSSVKIAGFSGNAIELTGDAGRFLCMSTTTRESLSAENRARLEGMMPLMALDVPTIELAGGSVRCMIADIHLTPRAGATAQ